MNVKTVLLSAILGTMIIATGGATLADDDDLGRGIRNLRKLFDDIPGNGINRRDLDRLLWDDDWDDDWDNGRRGRDYYYDPRYGRYYDEPDYRYDGFRSSYDAQGRMIYPWAGRASNRDAWILMDRPDLLFSTRAATLDFDRQLRTFPTGNVWRTQFRTAQIIEMVENERRTPGSAADQDAVAEIRDEFDDAMDDPDLRAITRLASFRAVRDGLRELAAQPAERLVRQLAVRERDLNRSLARFDNGLGWQRYLALPSEVARAGAEPLEAAKAVEEVDSAEYATALDRYDSVSRTEEYRGIARLPEFQATHRQLASYVELLRERKAVTTTDGRSSAPIPPSDSATQETDEKE